MSLSLAATHTGVDPVLYWVDRHLGIFLRVKFQIRFRAADSADSGLMFEGRLEMKNVNLATMSEVQVSSGGCNSWVELTFFEEHLIICQLSGINASMLRKWNPA